jgi:hypothetical protein
MSDEEETVAETKIETMIPTDSLFRHHHRHHRDDKSKM